MRLTPKDLEEFQRAIQKDYGIMLGGKKLYQEAFNLLKFFETLIKLDREDKGVKTAPESQVRKSSKPTS